MKNKKTQSGNVLFLILIAVALFAALSYAVTQSTRGAGNADNELQEIEQATLENCNASIQASSMRVEVMNGCTSNELSYELPNGTNVNPNAPIDKSCHIFSPGRGGAAPCGPWLDGCNSTQLAALSGIGDTCGYIVYAGLSGGNRIYTTIGGQTKLLEHFMAAVEQRAPAPLRTERLIQIL